MACGREERRSCVQNPVLHTGWSSGGSEKVKSAERGPDAAERQFQQSRDHAKRQSGRKEAMCTALIGRDRVHKPCLG